MSERNVASPSPLNGERAGVRGESVEKVLIPQALGEECPPHLTLPSLRERRGNVCARL